MERDTNRIRETIDVAIAVDNALVSAGNESSLLDLVNGLVAFVEGMDRPHMALEAIKAATASKALTEAPVADDVNPVARFLIGAHAIYDPLRLGAESAEELFGEEEKRVCDILGISMAEFLRSRIELKLQAAADTREEM